MMNTMEKTFYISSKELSSKAILNKEYEYNGFYIGTQSDYISINKENDTITISFDEINIVSNNTKVNCNYVKVGKNNLEIVSSDMNTQAVFFINIPEKNIFIVFNDLMIAKDILAGIEVEVKYDLENKADDLSFFKHVNRLKFGEKLCVYYDKDKLMVEKSQSNDILLQASEDYTYEEAKEKFYTTLFNATKELTDKEDEVYISLSGGIDSGTIAYILKQLNKKVNAYTLGTDWGNEYNEAQETADFLGINLTRIHISNEEIINEVPNVIRFFGFKDSVSIEIALVAFCLYKKLNKEFSKNMTFVTGYGSDLLNAGIYSSFNHYSELKAELLKGLRKTQISNEFCNLSALNFNVKNIHPFWHSDVIREALRIPVEYKVKDGKDKYFFRSMMEGKLPSDIVWRKKRGAHQGSGLNEYLKGAIEKVYGESAENKLNYKKILENVHKDIFLNGMYPWKNDVV